MIQQHKQNGFTLVELMLAMAFVGVLIIAVAMTSMQIMSTYNKGVTIREVNQVGRSITDDIQRTIASSTPFSVQPNTGSSSPIDSKYVVRQGGGRLCTGSVTYAWNYGGTRELSGDSSKPSVYNTYQGGGDVIRFAKVTDVGGLLCVNVGSQIPRQNATELLQPGDRNLAVQSMTVTSHANGRDDASGQALYAINLVIGTNDRKQLNASSTACLPPNQGESGDDFCAINQFSIIARAGNRSGSL